MGRFAQNIIDACMPAWAGRAIMLRHVGIKPQGDVLLGLTKLGRTTALISSPFTEDLFKGRFKLLFKNFLIAAYGLLQSNAR
jgi:hypothetical protein